MVLTYSSNLYWKSLLQNCPGFSLISYFSQEKLVGSKLLSIDFISIGAHLIKSPKHGGFPLFLLFSPLAIMSLMKNKEILDKLKFPCLSIQQFRLGCGKIKKSIVSTHLSHVLYTTIFISSYFDFYLFSSFVFLWIKS